MQQFNHTEKIQHLAIVHYMPLEFYPPIINLLNHLSTKKDLSISVFSTINNKKRKPYVNNNINVFRTGFPNNFESSYVRLAKYWAFNLFTLFKLFIKKPNTILYYESYSAWPVYFYLKYFNSKCKLFIHYHEYSPPQWYKTGMRLVRWYHRLEKKHLFPKATWISQTNSDRLELFFGDFSFTNKNKLHVLPNYPPSSWAKMSSQQKTQKFSIIYVGSLSLIDTYIKEFCEWVKKHPALLFDVYSFNYHKEAGEYLEKLNAPNIRFFNKGVEYSQLPGLLKNYNIGAILYKASSLNYIYNAPNKLFEYLACGLDVWFPTEMKGCYNYVTKGTYPKVSMLDFQNLQNIEIQSLLNHKGLKHEPSSYFCEPVYEKLYNALLQ